MMHWNRAPKISLKIAHGTLLPSSIVILLLFLTSFATSLPPRVDFGGENFNFLVFPNPPFDVFVRGPNNTVASFTGVALNILHWIATKYNFKYTLVPVNESLVERYGMHEAAFYQLINEKKIDGIPCAFFLTQDRINRMDYTSYFVWVDGLSLIVPKPGEQSRLFAFIGPFQPSVWFWILVTIIFVVGVMTFFTWFYFNPLLTNAKNVYIMNREERDSSKPSQPTVYSSLSSNMIYIVNIMTNQVTCQIGL
ncbi:uncharacterized protein LOC124207902 [Daphnia pulex]|uniref:uncharacterized protein LOC124207902 n=1 Tax=Daphnia pulex TaxID=6669 RepID=UPI001EDF5A83|nr:uncharacterized protein LOC124207902 [Daphnia pulex]